MYVSKGLIGAAFNSSEPFHLLRLMGMLAPSQHRESSDSQIEEINVDE